MDAKNEKNKSKRVDTVFGITYVRKRNKLTLEEMSSRIGVSKQTISKYESGKLNPSNEVLEALVKEFGQTKEFYTRSLEKLDFIKFEKEDLQRKINEESNDLEPIEQTIIDENGEEKTIMVKPVDTEKVRKYQLMVKSIRNLEVAAQLESEFFSCNIRVEGEKNTYKFKDSMENMEIFLSVEEKFVDIIKDSNVDGVKFIKGLDLLHKALVNNSEGNEAIDAIINEINK